MLMRKWNAMISAAILILFLVHAIAGIFELAGLVPGGSTILTACTYIMVVLLVMHVAIGIKLTADTFKAQKAAPGGTPANRYLRENSLFWTRRISGMVLMVMLVFHAVIMSGESGAAYRLNLFEGPQLAASVLLILALAVHILSNIRPLYIAFGIRRGRIYLKDVMFVLAVVLAAACAAFIIYYLRWNVNWRP